MNPTQPLEISEAERMKTPDEWSMIFGRTVPESLVIPDALEHLHQKPSKFICVLDEKDIKAIQDDALNQSRAADAEKIATLELRILELREALALIRKEHSMTMQEVQSEGYSEGLCLKPSLFVIVEKALSSTTSPVGWVKLELLNSAIILIKNLRPIVREEGSKEDIEDCMIDEFLKLVTKELNNETKT